MTRELKPWKEATSYRRVQKWDIKGNLKEKWFQTHFWKFLLFLAWQLLSWNWKILSLYSPFWHFFWYLGDFHFCSSTNHVIMPSASYNALPRHPFPLPSLLPFSFSPWNSLCAWAMQAGGWAGWEVSLSSQICIVIYIKFSLLCKKF